MEVSTNCPSPVLDLSAPEVEDHARAAQAMLGQRKDLQLVLGIGAVGEVALPPPSVLLPQRLVRHRGDDIGPAASKARDQDRRPCRRRSPVVERLDAHRSPRLSLDLGRRAGRIRPGLHTVARAAEDVGVRALSFMDHWFQMDRMAPAQDPMLEGYTALGFVAGRTRDAAAAAPRHGMRARYPGLLAKTVTTLDVVSSSRRSSGSVPPGTGDIWDWACRLPPLAERFERLEGIQICLQMWSADNGPYLGKHYRLEETLCEPAPVSGPRPRILIGGSGEKKTLLLVARYADACNIFGSPDVVAHKFDVLRRHCENITGATQAEIEVTALLGPVGPDADRYRGAPGRGVRCRRRAHCSGRGRRGRTCRWLETMRPAISRLNQVETKPMRVPAFGPTGPKTGLVEKPPAGIDLDVHVRVEVPLDELTQLSRLLGAELEDERFKVTGLTTSVGTTEAVLSVIAATEEPDPGRVRQPGHHRGDRSPPGDRGGDPGELVARLDGSGGRGTVARARREPARNSSGPARPRSVVGNRRAASMRTDQRSATGRAHPFG